MTATPAADRQLPGELLPGDAGDAEHAASPPGDGRAPALTDELAIRQRPRIDQMAATLAAQLAQRGEADLMDDFAEPLAYTAVCDVIGVSPHDRRRLHDWTQEWRLFRRNGDGEHRCAARRAVYDYVSGLLADRVENPRDDLCTQFATAFRDGRLPAHEAIATAAGILLNGYPYPASFISGMLLGLLLDHGHRELLGRQPDLIPAAVEEFLRVLSPEREGPAQALVSRADPGRPGNGHDAFASSGGHCPGATLARLEARAAVTAMLPHLSQLTVAVPVADLSWSRARFGHPTALERCPVTWRQR
ncbi:MAG TPA: hypothetical protein VH641_21380 [Streptosporangiaceae bacterium]